MPKALLTVQVSFYSSVTQYTSSFNRHNEVRLVSISTSEGFKAPREYHIKKKIFFNTFYSIRCSVTVIISYFICLQISDMQKMNLGEVSVNHI